MEKYPIVASCRTTQNVPSKYLEQNGWTLLLFLYKIVGVARPILGYLHIFCYKKRANEYPRWGLSTQPALDPPKLASFGVNTTAHRFFGCMT